MRSSGGKSSKAIPGATQRRGPANCAGEARSLQIGSVNTFTPSSWINRLECPTQVTVRFEAAARGDTNLGWTRAKIDASGSFGRGRVVRCTSIHFSRLPNPGTASATHGLRNPPPGRGCDGSRSRLTAGQYSPTMSLGVLAVGARESRERHVVSGLGALVHGDVRIDGGRKTVFRRVDTHLVRARH